MPHASILRSAPALRPLSLQRHRLVACSQMRLFIRWPILTGRRRFRAAAADGAQSPRGHRQRPGFRCRRAAYHAMRAAASRQAARYGRYLLDAQRATSLSNRRPYDMPCLSPRIARGIAAFPNNNIEDATLFRCQQHTFGISLLQRFATMVTLLFAGASFHDDGHDFGFFAGTEMP